MTFLDTNILVYSVDPRDKDKQSVASTIVESAIGSSEFRISAQVLFEFSNVCLRKFKFTPERTIELLGDFDMIACLAQDAGLVRRTVEIKGSYGISIQDAMIVAAAEKSGCDELLTEDLNDGQVYAGVRVRNPFK